MGDRARANLYGFDCRTFPRGIRAPVAEIFGREVTPEQCLSPLVALDPLIDVLTNAPALILTGEVVVQLLVVQLGQRARCRINRQPEILVLDRVLAGREIALGWLVVDRQERVAETRHP